SRRPTERDAMQAYQVRGLRELRSGLFKRVRTIHDRVERRGHPTGEESGEIDRVEREIDRVEAFLRRAAADGASAPDELHALRHHAFATVLRGIVETRGEVRQVLRDLAPELRAALNVGTGAQGGFTVPVEFDR